MSKENRDEVSKTFSVSTEMNKHGDGFIARWTAPGMAQRVVRDEDGEIDEFESVNEAKIAAAADMFRVLNKPRKHANKGKPEVYVKMEANEFAVALGYAGITPSFFAYLYGTSQDRVLKWIDGAESVPHPARILLAILIEYGEEAVDIAETETANFTKARRPERTEA